MSWIYQEWLEKTMLLYHFVLLIFDSQSSNFHDIILVSIGSYHTFIYIFWFKLRKWSNKLSFLNHLFCITYYNIFFHTYQDNMVFSYLNSSNFFILSKFYYIKIIKVLTNIVLVKFLFFVVLLFFYYYLFFSFFGLF